jgi:hypothetical protein
MFVELWAYLADVLTFYQERIANEAFITTATRRDSLLRLAELIDYRPGPGAGASALVAFTVQKDKAVTVPAGFRVGSKAAPGRAAAVFETSTAVKALADHNAIPVATVRCEPVRPHDVRDTQRCPEGCQQRSVGWRLRAGGR